jgi:hypothetical protein
VDILIECANGASYATIRQSHKRRNDESLVHFFIHTTLGFFFGGAMSYLSDLDLHKLTQRFCTSSGPELK